MPRSAKARVTVNFEQRKGHSLAALSGGASVSRSYGGQAQDAGTIVNMIANELVKTIRAGNERHFFQIEAKVLAKRLAEEVNAELMRVGQFIATQLIGTPSGPPGGGTTFIDKFEGAVEAHWQNLSLRTIRTKQGNKDRFFLHSGSLKQDIRANVGRNLVALNPGIGGRTGGKEITHGPVRIVPYRHDPHNQKVYKIAEIEVNLFSQSRANRIASILNEDIFDAYSTTRTDIQYLGRKMGLSQDSIDKLMGPALTDRDRTVSRGKRGIISRPLLEPALAYFFAVRVPRAVTRVINRYRISEIR